MYALLKTLGYARGMAWYYGGVATCSILVALASVAVPFVISHATNLMVQVVEGNGNIGVEQAFLLAVLLLLFDVAQSVIRNMGGYWGDILATKLKAQLSTRYYHHLLQLPQSYYDRELTGTIINRLNRAITGLGAFLSMFATTLLPMLLTTVVTIGIVAWYRWQLAVLIAAMYPLCLWLTALTNRRWRRLQRHKNHETDMASGRFAEVMSQMKVVKSYVRESLEYRHFTKRYRKTIAVTRKQSWYWHAMDLLRSGVVAVFFFVLFVYIFLQTTARQLSIADMVLLLGLVNNLRLPLLSLSQVIESFQKAIASSKDFVRAMRLAPGVADRPGAQALSVPHGRIEFRSVSFCYPSAPGRIVLRRLSFTAEPGQQVALVGQSGVGKTTITNLLMRLYDVSEGAILIDGVDISQVTQHSLRQAIATVFQEPALFSGTIRENIAYGQPMASEEAVVAAAVAANADGFIRQLDRGYSTQIGEHGARLSGGQKQRIAIARAILKNAPILILDEATSNLDNHSEQLVRQALERLMEGRTTLIIAHRLDTIAKVDRIVTLKHGRVDEVGSPRQLASTDGMYATLLKVQRLAGQQLTERLAAYDIGQPPKR